MLSSRNDPLGNDSAVAQTNNNNRYKLIMYSCLMFTMLLIGPVINWPAAAIPATTTTAAVPAASTSAAVTASGAAFRLKGVRQELPPKDSAPPSTPS